jgi:hypothetical protein
VKKWLVAAVALLIVVAIACTVTAIIISQRGSVTKQNLVRVEIGMTLDEVSAVLGKSPVGFGRGQIGPKLVGGRPVGKHVRRWQDEDGWAVVSFDENGRTFDTAWEAKTEIGPFRKVFRWLGLERQEPMSTF